jgi:ribonuclease J
MRVKESLIELIAEKKGRVAVTTFASNVSRVVSICAAARAADRSVCLLGRSMLRIVGAAREVGLLPAGMSFVEPEEAGHLPREHVLYLCTGSQGEQRAALARIARDDHPDLALSEGDTVIFSSKIIPGNERTIFTLINDLVELGTEVITEKDAFVHVSGHPNRDELRRMYEWVRPAHAVPVHGEARHLEEHAEFAMSLGVRTALSPRNGELIRLAPGDPVVVDEVPAGRLYLDGDFLLPEGAAPMRDRRKLGYAGVVAVSIAVDERGELATLPQMTILGAPRETPGADSIVDRLVVAAERAVEGLARAKRQDDETLRVAVMRAVRNDMTEVWGKRPIVDVIIHRV